MGHPWTWYAVALAVVYRLTLAGLDAAVRRVVRTASQATAELRFASLSAPASMADPESSTAGHHTAPRRTCPGTAVCREGR
ncbi:hypothetical protein [Streptomyces xiamenensis]|uniref:hypothetical protein n=1 Tax=Streptomyces xiamenensis TaxID=408015 RepID=UPI0035E1340E